MPAVEHSQAGRQWRTIVAERKGADRVPNQLSLRLCRPSGNALERGNSVIVEVDGGLYHTSYMVAGRLRRCALLHAGDRGLLTVRPAGRHCLVSERS